MTNEELIKRFPNASRSFLRQNSHCSTGLRAAEPKPIEGHALEGSLQRESKGSAGAIVSPEPCRRSRIKFTIYAVRPCDWDGYHIKELQDLLVKSGILDGDEWNLLQGEVISEKVHSKEEERTEIELRRVS